MTTPKIPETLAEARTYENSRIAPSIQERIADPFLPHRLCLSDEMHEIEMTAYADSQRNAGSAGALL